MEGGDLMSFVMLHGSSQKCSQAEQVLMQALGKYEPTMKIEKAKSPKHFMETYAKGTLFSIYIIFLDNTAEFLANAYHDYQHKTSLWCRGTLSLPLDPLEIEKKLSEYVRIRIVCPYGAYYLKNRTVFRKIIHEDIEYISKENKKCVFHLKNGETESEWTNLKKIRDNLDMKLFVKCGKKYIINIFNVAKMDKSAMTVKLKSGTTLKLKRGHYGKLWRVFCFSVLGLARSAD